MADVTEQLAAKLDEQIIENFADLYVMEGELGRIERTHDLDDPDVIAALATCADIAAVQKRLVTRPAGPLASGLARALARGKLRPSAELLVRALHAGAERQLAAGATPAAASKAKHAALPAFARPERLPPLVTTAGTAATRDDVVTVLERLRAAKPGDRDALDAARDTYTAAALGELGRALALGWLSHGAPPGDRWGLYAAAQLPADATARDLAMMAAALAPRVGQSLKAVDLVDTIAGMGTLASLEALQHLATTVTSKSVRDGARAAFDAAARRLGTSKDDLADRLLPATPTPKQVRDFVRRLEARMVEGQAIDLRDLIEGVMQHAAARTAAAGVVFAVRAKRKLGALFTIAGDALVDVAGTPVELARDATLVVVHPLALSAKQLAAWQRRLPEQPFPQLARPVQRFVTARALARHLRPLVGATTSPRKVFALEALGWKRGPTPGGVVTTLVRELLGTTAELELDPGVSLARGMATEQRIAAVRVRGTSPIALAELARELATLR